MTNPFAVQPGGVIQSPGIGGALVSSLAQVLAAQQQQKENAMRQQQLLINQQQQAALAQYYQGQLSLQSREQASKDSEAARKRAGQAQVGTAVLNAFGQPTQPSPLQGALQGGAQAIGGPQGYASIFSGVAPENVPAAAEAVQALTPKPPEEPTNVREYQYMQRLHQIDPSGQLVQEYVNTFHRPPAPAAIVNNIPAKGETAFAVETGKADAAAGAKLVDESNKAASSFPALAEAYKLIDKSFTGFAANQALGVARAIGATGFKPAQDKAANTQEMVKLLREGVIAQLQTRALGSGTAVSDADRVFMERQAGADISLQPDAIKRIIRINIGTGIEKMVSAKMELQLQQQSYPESSKLLQGKIDLIDRKLKPLWKQYQEMLANEAKSESQNRMDAGPAADQLFPQR